MFGRDTNWRQGSVLDPENTKFLNLIEENCSNRIAIVITHDCDLASDLEEFIDVIVAVRAKELDPMIFSAILSTPKFARQPGSGNLNIFSRNFIADVMSTGLSGRNGCRTCT